MAVSSNERFLSIDLDLLSGCILWVVLSCFNDLITAHCLMIYHHWTFFLCLYEQSISVHLNQPCLDESITKTV